MRSCIAAGNTGGALSVYKQLWTCLEQEYDVEPSAATQELVVAIRNGTYRPPPISFETRNVAAHPNIEDLDSVIRLAVQLAIAWAAKSEPGVGLDASALMRMG